MRILNSSLKYEWEEGLYTRGGEWSEFHGEEWFLGGDFLWEDCFQWGSDEKFGDDEGFRDDEEFGGGEFSFGVVITGGIYFFRIHHSIFCIPNYYCTLGYLLASTKLVFRGLPTTIGMIFKISFNLEWFIDKWGLPIGLSF